MTLPAKHTKLNDLKDEVRELHPILNKLFHALPNIVECEYTQGPSEKGADFVLLKRDDVSGFDDHVGVIAKIGGIQQNFSEVERQIKECKLERYFRNGKEKIRIREIWVVCTGTITENAKDRIFEEFKNEKINFLDGKRLESLVDTYVPYVWQTESVEIGKYLSETRLKVEEAEKRLSLIPGLVGNLFIEPEICTYPRQKNTDLVYGDLLKASGQLISMI